jgi:hypothetical protein
MQHKGYLSPAALSRVIAGWLLLLQFSAAYGATQVHGENRTCADYADLDPALEHPGSGYFQGWTSEDFDAAVTWITSCAASPPSDGDRRRMALLAQRRQALQAAGELQRNDKALQDVRQDQLRDRIAMETDKRAAEEARWSEGVSHLTKQQTLPGSPQGSDDARLRADEERARDVMETRRTAHDQCLRSDVYQRYWAGTHVLQAMDQKSKAQQALDHEKEMVERSGTTHPDVQDSALQSVARADDDIKKWWAVYRQYGGDGPGPEAVPKNTSDPCPSIQ